MEKIFEEIYKKNGWGSRESVSGPGSEIAYTKTLRAVIPIMWDRLKVKRLLDAPCGDLNWMKYVLVDTEIDYIGCDIVPQIIKNNMEKYAGERRSFKLLDITLDPLPTADMWMCRDCLFHFSFADIWKVIQNFQKSEISYFFTTRSIIPTGVANQDIGTGGWRPLDLIRAPFNFDPEPIFRIVDYIDGYPPREMCVWTREQMVVVAGPR